jgi:hypothetical protein
MSETPVRPDPHEVIARLRRYAKLQTEPEFIPCPKCSGKGYHHGFGEHGHDPDWCEECGGPGELCHPDGNHAPEDIANEAADTIESLLKEREEQRSGPDLVAFATRVMESWPWGDVDGGNLQEIAHACGLLREESVSVPCGEECACVEYHGLDATGSFHGAPVTCYRRVPLAPLPQQEQQA